MDSRRAQAEETIRVFLRRADKQVDFDDRTSLFADGLGLDSLEAAELSAMLEDAVHSDPFSQGLNPETIGDVLAFYDETATVSS